MKNGFTCWRQNGSAFKLVWMPVCSVPFVFTQHSAPSQLPWGCQLRTSVFCDRQGQQQKSGIPQGLTCLCCKWHACALLCIAICVRGRLSCCRCFLTLLPFPCTPRPTMFKKIWMCPKSLSTCRRTGNLYSPHPTLPPPPTDSCLVIWSKEKTAFFFFCQWGRGEETFLIYIVHHNTGTDFLVSLSSNLYPLACSESLARQ